MKESFVIILIKSFGVIPLWLVRVFGAFVGRLMYHFNNRAAQVTRINIQHCFPASSKLEQENLVRISMMEFGKTLVEIPKVMQNSSRWVSSKFKKVHNRDLLIRAAQSGRGVVLLCPHIGNWELMATELAKTGDATIMYEPLSYPKLDEMLRACRSKSGAKLVPTNKKGVMRLIKTLRIGGTAMLLPDQTPELESGCYASFFQKQALTMTLAHKLVKRTGSLALMASALRVPGGFDIFYDEIGEEFFGDNEVQALNAMNKGVEKCIARAPTQYQWEYKRFKRPLTADEKIY